MSWTWRLAMGGLALWLVAAMTRAQTPRDLVQQGNQHYAAGRYADALASYRQAGAAEEMREKAEILHNEAAAYFKLGQVDEARDRWMRLKEVADPVLAARSRYNLGNCDYAEALGALERQDFGRALELLGQASEQFRAALRLDPGLTDARANLELAHRLRRQIQERLHDQPQTQAATDQAQEQSQAGRPPSTSASSAPASQPSGRPESSEQSQPQTQPAESAQSQQAEAEPQGQPPGSESPPGQQGAPTGPERQSALEETGRGEEDQTVQGVPVHLTREQAERLLQMIRDAEKARREMLARQQAAGQKPVDRDW